MEDGFVLGVVLHGASTPKDIGERLKTYEKIRRNRASVIQILSNVGADEVHRVRDELSKYMRPADIPSELPAVEKRMKS
jgi:salicylate hydroxylase